MRIDRLYNVTAGLIGAAEEGHVHDHADLTGLAADDHTQYVLADGTRDITGPQEFKAGLELFEQSEPGTPAADTLAVWAEDVSGITVLNIKGPAGEVTRLARDNIVVVRNTSGSPISRGEAVYVSGETGNKPNIALARSDAAATMPCIGLAFEDIGSNAWGRVLSFGVLESVNTSSFSPGDSLRVSSSVAGALVATPPAAPSFQQGIGTVLSSGVGNGSILVGIRAMTQDETGSRQNSWALGDGAAGTKTIVASGSGTLVVAGRGVAADGATLDAHVASTSNPHSVTAAQAGADPAGTAAAAVAAHDVANRHVDHSAVQVATSATSGLNGGGDLTATRNLVLDPNRLTAGAALNFVNDRLVYYEDAGATTKKIAPAKLINDPGTTVTDIWSGSKITAQLATKANTIHTHAASEVTSGTFADARIAASNVTQHTASINHNALSNYVADQHVAHSGVSISTPAASGLSGGGTIAATRSLALDINGMTLGIAVDTANDRVAIYDADVAAHRKVSVNLLIAALNASNLVSGSVPDARITKSNVQQHLTGTGFPVSPADGDPWFHKTFREWFSWDSTNSVWLSESLYRYSFGTAAASNNAYLGRTGATTSAQSRGYHVHFDIAIVRITGTCNTVLATGHFRVRRSDSATNIASLDVATHGAGRTFDSGAIYAAFNKASGADLDGGMTVYLDTLNVSSVQTNVDVWFRRRET